MRAYAFSGATLGLALLLTTGPGWAQDDKKGAGASAQAEKSQRARVVPASPPSTPPPSTPPTAAVAGELGIVTRVNNWTVGVAGGLLEGTFIRFASELAKALDDGDNLRVLPVVSYGAAENVSDLLYLKGIDISITHADVLDDFKRNKKAANINKRVNYISQMYVSELHVLARTDIRSLKDLEGKKVGFHTKGAGPTVTGPIVFERLGIKVEPVYINNALAIEKMRSGEIAAILHNAGKPNDFFTKMKAEPDFHFLPVEYTDKFADYYLPSTLRHEDYPNLLKPGEKVETLGIPVVLAVYNWPKDSDRARRVERFIQYYFTRFEALSQPSFHPKWKEINLAAKVPGWERYWAAEEHLAKLSSPVGAASGGPAATAFDPQHTRQQAARAAPRDRDAQDRLFKQFLEWKKGQEKQ